MFLLQKKTRRLSPAGQGPAADKDATDSAMSDAELGETDPGQIRVAFEQAGLGRNPIRRADSGVVLEPVGVDFEQLDPERCSIVPVIAASIACLRSSALAVAPGLNAARSTEANFPSCAILARRRPSIAEPPLFRSRLISLAGTALVA